MNTSQNIVKDNDRKREKTIKYKTRKSHIDNIFGCVESTIMKIVLVVSMICIILLFVTFYCLGKDYALNIMITTLSLLVALCSKKIEYSPEKEKDKYPAIIFVLFLVIAIDGSLFLAIIASGIWMKLIIILCDTVTIGSLIFSLVINCINACKLENYWNVERKKQNEKELEELKNKSIMH